MEISLSLESLPLADRTVEDIGKLLVLFPEEYKTLLHEPAWQMPDAKGFTVLAYTEDGELVGCAVSLDLLGLHQYEWSVIVHPDVRRQSLGSALVDGVQYGLQQRQAEGELAAGPEDAEAAAFLESLGYTYDFKEILFGAEPLKHSRLPDGVEVIPYERQNETLETFLTAAFDGEVIPVIEYNFEEAGQGIWTMEKQGTILAVAAIAEEDNDTCITAFAVQPSGQEKGYGQAFLNWCRYHAYTKGKDQVLLDANTSNIELKVYEKAGFRPVNVTEYWRRNEG